MISWVPIVALSNQTAVIDPKAAKLLAKVDRRLHSIQSLSAKCKLTVWSTRNPKNSLPTVRVETTDLRMMRPNLVRLDRSLTYLSPGETTWRKISDFQTLAADGGTEWRVFTSRHEVESWTANPRTVDVRLPTAFLLDSFFDSNQSLVKKIPAFQSEGLLISLTVSHQKLNDVNFNVVRFVHHNVGTEAIWDERFFIGKDDLIHRIDSSASDRTVHRISELTRIQINPALTKKSFVYKLPKHMHPRVETAEGTPATLQPGTVAPDFEVQDMHGKPIRLSNFRGKFVILDFWATWCGPCLQEMPYLSAIAQKYKGHNLAVFAVDTADSPAAFQSWLPKHPEFQAFTFALDPEGIKGKGVDTAYKVAGLPTQYVIGPDGKILAYYVGYSGDRERPLEKFIQAACPP